MTKSTYLFILFVWGLVSIVVLTIAHFYPQVHYGYNYYGIAYSMWVKHEFWYPVWLDSVNVQKPPLFYWLTLLCWKLFGINSLFMPIIILICYLLISIFTAKTCFILSKNKKSAEIAGLLVLINITFLKYITLIRFDIQLTFSFMLAFYALMQIIYNRKTAYVWVYALANLLGLFFKGPVILLFTLPASLLGLLLIDSKSIGHHLNNKTRYLILILLSTLLVVILNIAWLIPANIHSHGVYLQTILSQTFQRFNHNHPDPNLPQLGATYHWWYSFGRLFQYLCSLFIVPFLFIWPLFIIRVYFGGKLKERKLTAIYLILTILIPTLFFAFFVGLMRSRYLLPLLPLVCIVLAYLSTPIQLTPLMENRERTIYRIFLVILLVLGIIIFLISFLPVMKPNMILSLLFSLGSFSLIFFTWNKKNFEERWSGFISGIIVSVYLFFAVIMWNLHPYFTLNKTSEKLQNLSSKQQALVEVNNDVTREGWAQFLARDLKLKFLLDDQFNELLKEHPKKLWVIYTVPLGPFKNFADQIYPLEFVLQPNHPIPVLMPYSVYKKVMKDHFDSIHKEYIKVS